MAAPIPALPPVTIACFPDSMSLLHGKGGGDGAALPAAVLRLETQLGRNKEVLINGARPRAAILRTPASPTVVAFELFYAPIIRLESPPLRRLGGEEGEEGRRTKNVA